ncbi:kelch repeat and BTB domain-containing protein 11-like [Lethenteron reissneri]|uniref:kelch repeat and BTB domain-containing protein 11-like n=1 Tax=Lethenteron reissneri TaxID=7753 RepID=UPI002AB7EDA6|nr:kelch repeat and BTB domain-containing protein 11-like [Lethenteron reissneri]
MRSPSSRSRCTGFISQHYLEALREPSLYGRLSACERDLVLSRRAAQGRPSLVVAPLEAAAAATVAARGGSRAGSRAGSRPQSPVPSDASSASSSLTTAEDGDEDEDEEGGEGAVARGKARWMYAYNEEEAAWVSLSPLPPHVNLSGCALCVFYNYLIVAGGVTRPGKGATAATATQPNTAATTTTGTGGTHQGSVATATTPCTSDVRHGTSKHHRTGSNNSTASNNSTGNNNSSGSAGPPAQPSAARSTASTAATAATAGTPSAQVWSYNPSTDVWAPLPPMQQARAQLRLVACDGALFAVGGECLLSVERYDPRAGRWRPVAPLPRGCFAVAHEAAESGGELYVSGGSLFRRLLRYSPRHDTWSECPMAPGRHRSADMVGVGRWLLRFESERAAAGSAAAAGGGSIAYGAAAAAYAGAATGVTADNSSSNEATQIVTVQRYNTHAKTWSTFGTLGDPRAILHAGSGFAGETAPPAEVPKPGERLTRSLAPPFRCAALEEEVFCVSRSCAMRFDAGDEGHLKAVPTWEGSSVGGARDRAAAAAQPDPALAATVAVRALGPVPSGRGLPVPFILCLPEHIFGGGGGAGGGYRET